MPLGVIPLANPVQRLREGLARPPRHLDPLLDHAVGEILLLRVARHVLEWQDRERGPVGQGQWRFGPRPRAFLPRTRGRVGEGVCRPDPVHPHRPCDVFQALLAEIE